jgi:hypothetical protein
VMSAKYSAKFIDHGAATADWFSLARGQKHSSGRQLAISAQQSGRLPYEILRAVHT